MHLRQATEGDRSAVERLIREHSDSLQQGIRFPMEQYVVVESFGQTLGCCALKVHGKKLAEIWSLAYSPGEEGEAVARLLVSDCERRAYDEGIHQLLIIARDVEFLGTLGFYTFNEEKYALLKGMEGIQAYQITLPPGIIIRPAEEEDERSRADLIAMYPEKLVQDLVLRPLMEDFCVVVVAGQVVGCCALDVYSPELAEIRSLVVHPDCAGMRLSRWLIADRINRAIELGVAELLAVTGAKALFERYFAFSTLRGAEYALLKLLKNQKEGKEASNAP